MRIIDGGFLSWMYGTTRLIHNGWIASKGRYSRRSGNLILLDSHRSFRAEFDPNYKSRRKLKRLEDPEQALKTAEVKRFKHEFIYPDPTLEYCEIDGLEADDLIGCIIALNLASLPLEILGVDKDLLQLPRGTCTLSHPTHGIATIEKYASKLPKAINFSITRPEDVLLSLILYGDKSDSVERILPLGVQAMSVFNTIRNDEKPFTTGYQVFGKQFLDNCYLTALPGPWCFDPIPEPLEVVELLDRHEWYSLPIRKDIQDILSVAINHVLKISKEHEEYDW